MKRFQRTLVLMMALCMVVLLMPMRSMAAETAEVTEKAVTNAGVDYLRESGRYPEIRIEVAEAAEEPVATDPAESGWIVKTEPTYAAPTYLTPEKAAVQLRKHMKNRTEKFDLYVKYDKSDFNELADMLFELAVAHTGVSTEGDYLLWHCIGWGGDVEYESTSQGWNFHYTVEMSYYTTAAQEKELTTAINSLLKTLNVSKKSDYEKVKAVYDYITENVEYDYATLEDPNYLLKFSAYAALVDKTAVCQGYATLLYRLMLELGVDCRVIAGEVITGEVNGEYTFGAHGWNIVKLGNVYYNLDATMDSELDPDLFFLRNSVIGLTHYRYLEYCSTQFHRDYPMSETDYVDGVAGQPEYVFALGTCGDDAYWAIDRDGKLTITGTGETYDYYDSSNLNDAAPWSYWTDGFNKVIVEEGITRLGSYLFIDGCGSVDLVSVTLPESLVSMGDSLFSGCDQLVEVYLPNNVKNIGFSAFQNCTNLKTVTLGYSLETIGAYAFYFCTSLEGIEFPESLKSIGSAAFQYCASLTEVYIPTNVATADGFSYCENLRTAYINSSSIGGYAFNGCNNLRNVILSDNMTNIQSCAFQNCTALEKITFPASVVSLGPSAFADCTALKVIEFLGDAPQFEYYTFFGVETTAYYPACNPTWTEDVRRDYSGTITWVPYECHNYEDVITPATSCTRGYTTHTCIYCGYSYVDSYVDALGHKMGEWEITKEVTCTEDGSKRRDCEACDHYETEVIATPGHKYESVITPPTATEQGYTTYTCSVCGDSYVGPTDLPEAEVAVARMILGNELAMQFAFPKADVVEGVDYVVSVTKTYADGKEDKTILVPQSEWKTSGSYYYVSFNGIAAKEMGDAIKVQIQTAGGAPAGDVYTDSVRDYAIRQLRKTTDAKTRTLYVDMLNYGAAAQAYFGYNADNLVTKELTKTEKGYGTKSVKLKNNLVSGTGYVASQLDLGSSILLRVKFNGIDSSMHAIISFTNHTGAKKTITIPGSEFISGGTVVVIDDVVAADYNQDVSIKVYDANGTEVANAVESVASYLARKLDKPNALAIYDAVAKYCAAAYSYLHR